MSVVDPVAAPDAGRRPRTSPFRGFLTVDMMLAAALLVLFVLALLQTNEWSFRTALFPRMVTAVGCLFAATMLVVCLVTAVRAHRRRVPGEVARATTVEDDEDRDHEVEYVYATAGGRAWTIALGWIALYISTLFLAGLFVAAAVFSFTYLKWGAGRTWRFAATYTVVLTGVLYVALGRLLPVSVPEGIFM